MGAGGRAEKPDAAAKPVQTSSYYPSGGNYAPKDVPYYYVPRVGERWNGLMGGNLADKPFLQRLDWIHVPLLISTPLIAAYGVYSTPFDWRTYAFAVFWYFVTGLGITAGYHRLFAHKCYEATWGARLFWLLAGAGAVEGSAKWWSRGHRAHHRYVDTDQDPYSAIKGFWYAHIGWMLVKQDKDKIGRADISDLNADPLVRWQHKFYLPIATFMAVVLPTLICGLGWGDYWGGYFIAGVARLVFVHHSTFCVNSLAHWAGSATYTDGHTARNSIITALVTLGEGYHNFHHEFPSDYRNGVEWWQYDPTKMVIYAMSLFGFAYNLKQFPRNEIIKGQLQMQQKKLEAEKRILNWGPDPSSLKAISRSQFDESIKKGAQWVIIDGFVCDVTKFTADHPGGSHLIKPRIGKDISTDFKEHAHDDGTGKGTNVGYYKHSNAARNLAETMRIARIEGYWAQ